MIEQMTFITPPLLVKLVVWYSLNIYIYNLILKIYIV